MITKGLFGFIIGRKKRFMIVNDDAEFLWQILVREIYIIMNHYNNIKESVQKAFEKIKICKGEPKFSDIEICKRFTDFSVSEKNWENLLRFCQSSFINLLEVGYILNNTDNTDNSVVDYKFEFDFNKWEARFYKKEHMIQSASIEEIMVFDDMPNKSYHDITSELNSKFYSYYEKICKIEEELEKLYKLKKESVSQGAVNIEEKVDKLIDDMSWEMKQLHMERRPFFYRLHDLNLLE
jgi:hypothetical protein